MAKPGLGVQISLAMLQKEHGRLQPGPALGSIREGLAQGTNSEEFSGVTLFRAGKRGLCE